MCTTSQHFHVSCFRHQRYVWIVLFFLMCSFLPSVSMAQQPTAVISRATTEVFVNGAQGGIGSVLKAGDMIETRAGTAVLQLSDGSLLEIGENTTLDITALSQTASGGRVSRLKLLWGRVRAALSQGYQGADSSFDIETPNALVGVQFSQPDVEVSYDPEKAETVALALTVELLAKNIITGEERIVPVGAAVIITAFGITMIAGGATAGVIAEESIRAGGTTDSTAFDNTATDTSATDPGASAGTSEAGAASTGTRTGLSTGTMLALGLGAAAAAGGVAILASGGDDDDDDDNGNNGGSGSGSNNFTGTFFTPDAYAQQGRLTLTIILVQSGSTVSGTYEMRSTSTESITRYDIDGTVSGLSADLRLYNGSFYNPLTGGWSSERDTTRGAELRDNGNTLRIQRPVDFLTTDLSRQ